MDIVTHKLCSKCKLVKSRDSFSPDSRYKHGLQCRCKSCANAAKKRLRDANKDAANAKSREYVAKNRERVYAKNNASRLRNQESVRASKKAHYERVKNTPEFIEKRKAYAESTKAIKSEYDKQYRKREPQKTLERAKNWIKSNPEKRSTICRAYAARRRSQTEGGISTRDLHEWTKAQPKKCYWCGVRCESTYHVDHYTPLSRGGKHEAFNLVIACAPCNLKKNAKDPLDFAREVGRLF